MLIATNPATAAVSSHSQDQLLQKSRFASSVGDGLFRQIAIQNHRAAGTDSECCSLSGSLRAEVGLHRRAKTSTGKQRDTDHQGPVGDRRAGPASEVDLRRDLHDAGAENGCNGSESELATGASGGGSDVRDLARGIELRSAVYGIVLGVVQ